MVLLGWNNLTEILSNAFSFDRERSKSIISLTGRTDESFSSLNSNRTGNYTEYENPSCFIISSKTEGEYSDYSEKKSVTDEFDLNHKVDSPFSRHLSSKSNKADTTILAVVKNYQLSIRRPDDYISISTNQKARHVRSVDPLIKVNSIVNHSDIALPMSPLLLPDDLSLTVNNNNPNPNPNSNLTRSDLKSSLSTSISSSVSPFDFFPTEPNLMMGFLSKREPNKYFWSKCFVVLDRGFISYYEKMSSQKPLKYPYGENLIKRYLLANCNLLVTDQNKMLLGLMKDALSLTKWMKIFCPGKKVLVRPYPNMSTEPVGELKDGDEFEIFHRTFSGFYYFADGRGYINVNTKDVQYINIKGPTRLTTWVRLVAQTPVSKKNRNNDTVKVNVRVNIRANPNLKDPVIGQLIANEVFQVYIRTVCGFFRLVDGRGYVNRNTKGVQWVEIPEPTFNNPAPTSFQNYSPRLNTPNNPKLFHPPKVINPSIFGRTSNYDSDINYRPSSALVEEEEEMIVFKTLDEAITDETLNEWLIAMNNHITFANEAFGSTFLS